MARVGLDGLVAAVASSCAATFALAAVSSCTPFTLGTWHLPATHTPPSHTSRAASALFADDASSFSEPLADADAEARAFIFS